MSARHVMFAAVLAASSSSSSSCVFPDTTVGDGCAKSSDCSGGKVCEPIDVDKPDQDLVCLPMPSVDAPVSCTSVDECVKAGFPVDVVCTGTENGTCTCPADVGFPCEDDTDDNGNTIKQVIDLESCKCIRDASVTASADTADTGQ